MRVLEQCPALDTHRVRRLSVGPSRLRRRTPHADGPPTRVRLPTLRVPYPRHLALLGRLERIARPTLQAAREAHHRQRRPAPGTVGLSASRAQPVPARTGARRAAVATMEHQARRPGRRTTEAHRRRGTDGAPRPLAACQQGRDRRRTETVRLGKCVGCKPSGHSNLHR